MPQLISLTGSFPFSSLKRRNFWAVIFFSAVLTIEDAIVAAYPESAFAVQKQIMDLGFLAVSIQKLLEFPWLLPP